MCAIIRKLLPLAAVAIMCLPAIGLAQDGSDGSGSGGSGGSGLHHGGSGGSDGSGSGGSGFFGLRSVPELDPSMLGIALATLAGGVLIIDGRRRR